MKTFTLTIAQNEKEVAKLGNQYGFNFNAAEVALAEAIFNDHVVCFTDTNEDSPGHYVNVVWMEDDGQFAQYVSHAAYMNFSDAVAELASVAASPRTTDLITKLRKFEQII